MFRQTDLVHANSSGISIIMNNTISSNVRRSMSSYEIQVTKSNSLQLS